MRSALVALALMFAAMPAVAACPSLPDDAASNYVENRTALALCQQRELGLVTDRAAAEAQIAVELGNLRIELERQLQQQQQQMHAGWPEL